VVWFGEPLPLEALERAEAAVRTARLVLVAGTSGMVYPAAGLPAIARAFGAHVVEINPDRTRLSDQVDERLAAPSGEVLPALLDIAREVGEPTS
jgi:NAD-dependent deacetylase